MSLLFVTVTLILFAALLATHVQLRRAVRSPHAPLPPLPAYPSVSVIRPIRGLDAGARENIAAALDTGYPGEIETIFVFDDESEPALPLVREAIEGHAAAHGHGVASVLIAGTPPPYRTGKLHAMIAGVQAARGDLIAFGDSDTRPDPLAIRRLVEKLLSTPGAGSAFAPVVVVSDGPRTAGDVGAALALNGLYGPSLAMAERRRGELPFIMGQLMIFRRDTLAAIGLENIRGELVDDMHIGMRVTAAGLRNVVSPQPLPIVVDGTSLSQFARMYRRWLIFSRSGLQNWQFNWPHWLRGCEFLFAFALTVGSVERGHVAAALLPAATVLCFAWSTVRLHEDLGGNRVGLRHAWMAFVLPLSAPFVFLSAVLHPAVDWRGRTYQLDLKSRLNDDRRPMDEDTSTPRSLS
jgi:ceramide glucosyltransferase